MSDVLQEAKDNGVDVMQSLGGIYEDIAFGVASFADFVTSYKYGGTEREYGVKGDYPWRLDLDITSDTERAIAQITSLKKLNGGDEPESTLTALWQSAGIGWRDGSRRVIALFTDAHVHDPEFYQEAGGGDYGPDPGPDAVFGTADDLDMWTTIDYLAEQGVAVFTVYYTSKPKSDVQFGFEQLAEGTGGGVVNLEEAGDLTRVLVDELGSSIRSVGILEARVSAENSTDLEIRVSPGRYETVASGDDRDFNVQITAAEKISKAGKSIVRVDFLADGNLTGTGEITVTLKRNFSWWWVIAPCLCLLAILLVVAAVFLIRWLIKRRAEIE